MRKAEVDYVLGTMLDFDSGVSDLNITADKPFQVESSGELVEVVFDPPIGTLTPFQTETLALNLINGSRRLTQDLLKTGPATSPTRWARRHGSGSTSSPSAVITRSS